RYIVLREVPFDRDADVSFESFVRRYNADLANDFGNLLNRTLNMTTRFVDGQRPSPQTPSSLASAWARALDTYRAAMEGYLLHDALAAVWGFVGEANRFVDQEQPWALAKQVREGDGTVSERLSNTLGDLLEACRLVGLAVAPVMPTAATRVWAQLGLAWPYQSNGSGGPRLAEQFEWGAGWTAGKIGSAEILFPRVEIEAAQT
ncbi:MAG: class I tRNA ligase family protein, partial [Chloroflexota bacterium]